MEAERRLLFRQGALFLFLSAVVGLVVAAQAPNVVKWRTVHVSGLMTGLLVIGLGALWSEVRLADRTRRLTWKLGLTAAWTGLALNVFGALVNFPGPASDPGRQPDAAWQMAVFFSLLAIIVPATLTSFFLVWRGLSDRGARPA